MIRAVRVAIGDAAADCGRLLAVVLESRPDITVVGVAEDWRELGTLIRSTSPHLLLLDTDGSGDGTVTVLKTVRLKRLPMAIVGLVGETEVNQAILPHLDAVVLKSEPVDEMLDTLLAVAALDESPVGIQDSRKESLFDSGSRLTATPAMEHQPIIQVSALQSAAPLMPAPSDMVRAEQSPSTDAQEEPTFGAAAGVPASIVTEETEATDSAEGDHVPLEVMARAPFPEVLLTQPSDPTGTPREFLPTDTVNLIVSPFGSFRSLGVFQQALEGLEGVKSARLRRFHQGTLYMIVEYDDAVPLEERLKELTQFAPRLVSSQPGLLEVHVTPGDREIPPVSTN